MSVSPWRADQRVSEWCPAQLACHVANAFVRTPHALHRTVLSSRQLWSTGCLCKPCLYHDRQHDVHLSALGLSWQACTRRWQSHSLFTRVLWWPLCGGAIVISGPRSLYRYMICVCVRCSSHHVCCVGPCRRSGPGASVSVRSALVPGGMVRAPSDLPHCARH